MIFLAALFAMLAATSWPVDSREAIPEAVVRPAVAGAASPGDWSSIDSWLGLEAQDEGQSERRLCWPVKVTAYSSDSRQCDEAPHLTASNTHARAGVIALSRDLLRAHNPSAPFDYGDRVYLEGVGEFIVEDTMSARHRRRADIWLPDSRWAMLWGVQERRLVVLPPDDLLL